MKGTQDTPRQSGYDVEYQNPGFSNGTTSGDMFPTGTGGSDVAASSDSPEGVAPDMSSVVDGDGLTPISSLSAPRGSLQDDSMMLSHANRETADGRGTLNANASGDVPDEGGAAEKLKDAAIGQAKDKAKKAIGRFLLAHAPVVLVVIAVILLLFCVFACVSNCSGDSIGDIGSSPGASASFASASTGASSPNTVPRRNNFVTPRVTGDWDALNEMFAQEDEEETKKGNAGTLVEKSLELACSAIGTDYLTEADAAKVGCGLDGNGRLHVPDSGSGTNPRYRAEGIPQTENIIKFWDEEKALNLGGIGWYGPASCSPWIGSAIRVLGYDDKIGTEAGRDNWTSPWTGEVTNNVISAHGEGCYMYYHPESFECIEGDPNKPIRDQCEPGDVLAHRYHILVYVGNEAAQEYFPGTTGDVVEAGEFGRAYPGVTASGSGNLGSYKIFRMKNKPAAGSGSGGSKVGTSAAGKSSTRGGTREKTSNAAQKILDSAQTTPSPGEGLCAKWISQVWDNAGYGYPPGNACDMYWSWCKSSSRADLQPGMIVAVPSHNHSSAGKIYGHVGIYMGNGMVRDNIGHIRDIPLDEWISYYGSSTTKWGWPNNQKL